MGMKELSTLHRPCSSCYVTVCSGFSFWSSFTQFSSPLSLHHFLYKLVAIHDAHMGTQDILPTNITCIFYCTTCDARYCTVRIRCLHYYAIQNGRSRYFVAFFLLLVLYSYLPLVQVVGLFKATQSQLSKSSSLRDILQPTACIIIKIIKSLPCLYSTL